jgi:hypothetical protein
MADRRTYARLTGKPLEETPEPEVIPEPIQPALLTRISSGLNSLLKRFIKTKKPEEPE